MGAPLLEADACPALDCSPELRSRETCGLTAPGGAVSTSHHVQPRRRASVRVSASHALSGAEELRAGGVQRRLLSLEGMASPEEWQPGPVTDNDSGLFQLLARHPAAAEHIHQIAAEEGPQGGDE